MNQHKNQHGGLPKRLGGTPLATRAALTACGFLFTIVCVSCAQSATTTRVQEATLTPQSATRTATGESLAPTAVWTPTPPPPTLSPAAATSVQSVISVTLHLTGTDGAPATRVVNGLLYTPTGYASEAGPEWPLILFLHGQLEWGDDPTVLTRQGLPRLISEGTDFPALVISPQSREGERWWPQTTMLLALLDAVQGEHRVDAQRIYLTGISMGGYGAWALAMADPARFAAVVPIAGGADYLPGDTPIPESICGLRDVPLWAFHGQLDNNVPVSASVNAVKALEACGGRPLLTVYPDVAHTEAWDRAYSDPALWAWLFAQERAD